MKISPTDLVLEIGSGNNPRTRSDFLCDFAIDDDGERGGRIVADRPIVEGDAQALPFRDGAFGYVIAAQVLEHVPEPERMLRELMRVASNGYIETPSEIAEWLYGWEFHRSVVREVQGKLVVRKKDFTSPFGQLFHDLARIDPEFRRFHDTHGHVLLVRHEWEGRIRYEVEAERTTETTATAAGASDALLAVLSELRERKGPSRWPRRWISEIKRLVPRPLAAWGKSVVARTRPRRRADLRDVVACPTCKGEVAWSETNVTCSRCAIDYPIVNGIARLRPR